MPIHDGDPQCGWYRIRLVKGGPWVPVEVRCEREIDPITGELTCDERLTCTVDGQRRDPSKIWTYLTPISRADFNALNDRIEHMPIMAATLAKIDLTQGAMRP